MAVQPVSGFGFAQFDGARVYDPQRLDLPGEKKSGSLLCMPYIIPERLQTSFMLVGVRAAVQAVSGKPKPVKFTPPPVSGITFR